MPKIFTSEKQKTGELGENLAVKFLMKQGYKILDRNYTKKWGELDIVAEKGNKVYFVEVKSICRDISAVTRETLDSYHPEDNMHPWKLKRLSRAIQTYMLQKDFSDDLEWQVDLMVVFIDKERRKARIKVVNDIVL